VEDNKKGGGGKGRGFGGGGGGGGGGGVIGGVKYGLESSVSAAVLQVRIQGKCFRWEGEGGKSDGYLSAYLLGGRGDRNESLRCIFGGWTGLSGS